MNGFCRFWIISNRFFGIKIQIHLMIRSTHIFPNNARNFWQSCTPSWRHYIDLISDHMAKPKSRVTGSNCCVGLATKALRTDKKAPPYSVPSFVLYIGCSSSPVSSHRTLSRAKLWGHRQHPPCTPTVHSTVVYYGTGQPYSNIGPGYYPALLPQASGRDTAPFSFRSSSAARYPGSTGPWAIELSGQRASRISFFSQ